MLTYIKRYDDKFLYVWYHMSMEDYIAMEGRTTIEDREIRDNEIVRERPDGSSDGLPEALDIDLGNGYKECSNWNPDLHKLWTLEALCPEIQELTAEQLVETFNKIKEQLFPGKTLLTAKEERKVYARMNEHKKQ